jgi:hypothetical protein
LEEFQRSETSGYDFTFRKHGCWQDVKLADMLNPPRKNYPFKCPYGTIGDRLWVRESFAYVQCEEDAPGSFEAGTNGICDEDGCAEFFHVVYASDVSEIYWEPPHFKPSIHMPRWVSRLTLEIIDIRVQRLQEITEEDAKAEGCQPESCPESILGAGSFTAKLDFAMLWDSINSTRAPWASNPWVWAITFERIA